MKRIDTKEIKRRVQEAHGRDVRVLSEFTGWLDKMTFECRPCKTTWDAKPQPVSQGTVGCPACSLKRRGARISAAHAASPARNEKYRQRIERVVEQHDLVWLNPDQAVRIRGGKQLEFRCRTCNHEWSCTRRAICGNRGCPECCRGRRSQIMVDTFKRNPKPPSTTTEKYREFVYARTQGRSRLVGEWRGWRNPRTIACNACDHTWIRERCNNKDGLLCPKCTRVSRFSSLATRWLDEEAKRRRWKIQHGRNVGEFHIPGTRIWVDGYNARTKTVFEFHGDAWHGNPRKYTPHSQPNPFSQRHARDLYKRTIKREQVIRDLGYHLVVMWEMDYLAMCRPQFYSQGTNAQGGSES